jgi:hypothetical protein
MNYNQIQFRHSLIYGAIFGLCIVILLLFLYIFGMSNNGNIVSLTPVIFIIGAQISVKHHRDRLNNGIITFGKAFGTSLLTCIFMGVVWAIYGYVKYKYFFPDLLKEELPVMQDMYLKLGYSEKMVENTSQYVTPLTMAFGYILDSAIMGSLLSLIIAAFYKRNTNPLTSNSNNFL